MARQGCRNQRWCQREGLTFALIFSLLSVCHAAGLETGDTGDIDYYLELTWQSETPRIWAGEVAVSGPGDLQPLANRLSEPKNVTPGMLLSGGITISDSGDSVKFAPSPSTTHLRDRDGKFVSQRTKNGGVVFRISGKADERIIIAFRRDDSTEYAAPVAISLKDLETGEPIESTFSATARYRIRRVADDRLRVSIFVESEPRSPDQKTRATSLLWDDQQATVAIACDAIITEPVELFCDTYADGHLVVATQSWPVTLVNGNAMVTDGVWQPPKGDASYELRWRLQRKVAARSMMGVSVPRNFTESITRPITMIRGSNDSNVIAESTSQVVVLSRQSLQPHQMAPNMTPNTGSVIGRIEPFGRSWSLSRLMPLRATNPFSNAPASTVDLKKASWQGKVVAELVPGAYWQQTLPIGTIGKRHRLTVHLPTDRTMALGVCILDHIGSSDRLTVIQDVTAVHPQRSQSNPSWSTATVDFYPRSSSAQLVLVNRDDKQSVHFDAIDVEIVGPHVSSSSLSATEESRRSRTALLSLSASQWVRWFESGEPNDALEAQPRHRLLNAALRLAESIRAEGYCGAMMTVCEDGMALYPTTVFAADQTLSTDVASTETLEMLARIFDRESLLLVPCIRPNHPIIRLEQAIAAGNSASRGITVSTPWTGQSLELSLSKLESASCGLYNPTNETVQEQIILAVGELADACQGHSCIRSIGVMMDEGSCLSLPPVRATLDSETLDRFHTSLPAGTVARSQLIAWIGEEGSSVFERWRETQLQTLCSKLIGSVAKNERNLIVITSSRQAPRFLSPLTIDPRFMLTRLYRRSPIEPLALRCRDEFETSVSLANSEQGNELPLEAALSIVPESEAPSGEADRRWKDNNRISSLYGRTTPFIDAETSALAVSQLLGRNDRLLVAFAEGIATQSSDIRRNSLLRFQSLPPRLMSDVVGANDAMKFVKLRTLSYKGDTYFAVTNQSRWPVTVDVSLTKFTDAVPLIGSDKSPQIRSDGTWQVSLAPGELVGLKVPATDCKVLHWSAQLQGGPKQLTDIANQIRQLADSIALIAEPSPCQCLENASFEEVRSPVTTDEYASKTGKSAAVLPSPVAVPGWLMAQHPTDCAVVDSEVAFDGKQSIRLRNQDGRPSGTWIVSRAIEPPTSGRLAVSFMIRGEPSEDPAKSEPILVRVAIEGAVAGSTLREAKQIQVRRDGKWGNGQVGQIPCRIEVNSLPRFGLDSLRLAIDVMNEGTVWIDHVQAENTFMTENEKRHLQSQLFLALGGMAKGELGHAAKLLESHWVQQRWVQQRLGSPSDLGSATISTSPVSTGADEQSRNHPPEPTTVPGIADRLKGWLPRPIRF